MMLCSFTFLRSLCGPGLACNRILQDDQSYLMTIRVRFAPSPTGHLHVGNARTALFNWLFAKRHQGTFLLRIEDTDLVRSEARFEELIFEDLRWLGMEWQEGPDIGGDTGPYRQSDRVKLYLEKADELVRAGKAYHCFCREADLEVQAEKAKAEGRDWKYAGTCQSLSGIEVDKRRQNGESSVIRLKVRSGPIYFKDLVHGAMEFDSDVISDPILIRSNGLPTYNYAVVVDDALMQITHVIRGDDHLSNTPKQVLIFEAFGWSLPFFAHLSTILGVDHSRLSKRHGATSVQNFQEMGILPEALVNYMALLGWSPHEGQSEIRPLGAIAEEFELERVSKSSAIFDIQKLFWINRHYLKQCQKERLISLAIPFLQRHGLISSVDQAISDWIGLMLDALSERVDHLSQLGEMATAICTFDAKEAIGRGEVQDVLKHNGAAEVILQLALEMSATDRDASLVWKDLVAAVKKSTGQKGKNLFHPIRVALTGTSSGPELDKLIMLYDTGSKLGLPLKVKDCRERVLEFSRLLS